MVDVMSLIFTVFTGIVGMVFGVVAYYLWIRVNVGVGVFLAAIRKKKPIIFLETDKTVHLTYFEYLFQGIGVTKTREIVVIPDGTLKFCPELRMMVGHGDFFRSITIPQEFRYTIDNLKKIGWNDSKIAGFFYDISSLKETDIIKKYSKELKELKENIEKKEEVVSDVGEAEKVSEEGSKKGKD